MKKIINKFIFPMVINLALTNYAFGNTNLESQALNWKQCIPQSGLTKDDIIFFGNRLTCATIKAPLDYSNPNTGTIDIVLSRITATKPEYRKGAIFLNPGGPGRPGLSRPTRYARVFDLANPNDPTGAKLLKISQEYDLIGFDPRGVGASTPLLCNSDQFLLPVNFSSEDRSFKNLDNINKNSILIASACENNKLTRYITTDATARDLDLARSLIGDKKLNYWGTSYGTWLGLWYASIFPERVDKMIIDGNMDVTTGFKPDAHIGSIEGKGYIFNSILIPYIAQNPGKFNLGNSVESIKQLFPSFDITLKDIFNQKLKTNKQEEVDVAAGWLTAAAGLHIILQNFPSATEAEIKQKVDVYVFSNDSKFNMQIKKQAEQLVMAYYTKKANIPTKVQLDNNTSSYRAITCNDLPSRTEPSYWNMLGDEYAKKYPLNGGSLTGNNCTSTWRGRSGSRPPLVYATKIPHILMVQTQYDGATTLSGAMVTFNSLPNANMVYVTNDYTHGTFPYHTECVDGTIADYLISGKLPTQRIHTCIGRSVLNSQQVLSATNKDILNNEFTNPLKATQAINSINDETAEAEENIGR